MQTKLATMSLVTEMLPLPTSRQYGNSYRGNSSQSAVSGDWSSQPKDCKMSFSLQSFDFMLCTSISKQK